MKKWESVREYFEEVERDLIMLDLYIRTSILGYET